MQADWMMGIGHKLGLGPSRRVARRAAAPIEGRARATCGRTMGRVGARTDGIELRDLRAYGDGVVC